MGIHGRAGYDSSHGRSGIIAPKALVLGQNPAYWANWNTATGFIETPPYSQASGKFSLAFRYTRGVGAGNSTFDIYNDARTNTGMSNGFALAANNHFIFLPDGTLKGNVLVNDANVTNRWDYITYNQGVDNKVQSYAAGFVPSASVVVVGWTPWTASRDWYIVVDNTGGGNLQIGIWTNYLLTASDAAALEAGWTP